MRAEPFGVLVQRFGFRVQGLRLGFRVQDSFFLVKGKRD